MSKVTSLIRWRHAPPQELADGLSSAFAACRLDHVTGAPIPAKQRAERSVTPQVQSRAMLRQIEARVNNTKVCTSTGFPSLLTSLLICQALVRR